jgi:hypothetical protein
MARFGPIRALGAWRRIAIEPVAPICFRHEVAGTPSFRIAVGLPGIRGFRPATSRVPSPLDDRSPHRRQSDPAVAFRRPARCRRRPPAAATSSASSCATCLQRRCCGSSGRTRPSSALDPVARSRVVVVIPARPMPTIRAGSPAPVWRHSSRWWGGACCPGWCRRRWMSSRPSGRSRSVKCHAKFRRPSAVPIEDRRPGSQSAGGRSISRRPSCSSRSGG